MRKLRDYLFISLIPLCLVLGTGCTPSSWPNQNPHESVSPSASFSNKDNSDKEALFASLKDSKDLKKLADSLLVYEYLTAPEVFLGDQFRAALFHFNRTLLSEAKKNKAKEVITQYQKFLLDRCDIEETGGCLHLKGLSQDFDSYRIALFLAEKNSDDLSIYWSFLEIALRLRPHWGAEPDLPIYFFENLQKIRKASEGFSEEKLQRVERFLQALAIELSNSKEKMDISHIFEEIRPELYDSRKVDVSNRNRALVLDLWLKQMADEPKALAHSLSTALNNSEDSIYSRSMKSNSLTSLIANHLPSISLCTFLADRVFTGAFEPDFANEFYQKITGKSECAKDIRPYILSQMLYESDKFFKELKEIIENINSSETPNSELLTKLRNKMPNYGQSWSRWIGKAETTLEFANLAMTSGDQELINEFSGLKKSLRRNVLMYIQFPTNLAFLSILDRYKNKMLGFFSILSEDVSTLIAKLIDKGEYFLDFGLLGSKFQGLSKTEIMLAFDFAFKSGVFENVGVPAFEVLQTIVKNGQIQQFNSLKTQIADFYKIAEGAPENKDYPFCLELYEYQFNPDHKFKNKFIKKIASISRSPILTLDWLKGSFFGTFNSRQAEQIRKLQQEYFISLRGLEDIVFLYEENLGSTETQPLKNMIKQRKESVYEYIDWFIGENRKLGKCTYGLLKESWKLHLKIVELEVQYLEKVHQKMTLLRQGVDPDDPKLSQVEKIFTQNTPLEDFDYISGSDFKFYTVGFYLRMAGYLEQGAFGQAALAPYVSMDKNLNTYSQKKLNAYHRFPYHPDKDIFVQSVLSFLFVRSGDNGIWINDFTKPNISPLTTALRLLKEVYFLNPTLAGKDFGISAEELTRLGISQWDTIRIVPTDEVYSESWVLSQRHLFEKSIIKAGIDNKNLARFFTGTNALAPLHFVVTYLLEEENSSPITQDPSAEDDGTGGHHSPFISEAVIKCYQGRNSLPHTLFPRNGTLIQRMDTFNNELIEYRIKKVSQLMCAIETKGKQQLLEFPGLTLESINSPLSLRRKAYDGSGLLDPLSVSLYNSYNRDISNRIPEAIRDLGPKLPPYKSCKENK